MSRRGIYTSDTHQVSTTALRSEQMCNYDLDDVDQRWLNAFNGERAMMGLATITELEMEHTIEEFEKQSWIKINESLKQNEIEDQEDVVCNVCRSVRFNCHSKESFLNHVISFFSLCLKSKTGWSFATAATYAFTRLVMASRAFLQVHGYVELAQ